MLTSADILVLPYDEQFSRAGVQYARDSLHTAYHRFKNETPDRLRTTVAGIAFEMATRRWLEAASIRYDRLGATTLSDPNRFDLAIGGRRFDLKCHLICDKSKIAELHTDPAWLLETDALVPEDQFASERLSENDVFVFGFVTGLEARHSTDTDKAAAKGLPVYMIHLPARETWAKIDPWQSLGDLIFKSNADEPLRIEIGGQDGHHKAVRERVKLPPHTRITALRDYYSVLYLGTPKVPTAAVGLHSSALKQTQVVEPLDWMNIWLYGQRVYLGGWLNKRDFREHSRRLQANSSVKHLHATQGINQALMMRDLRPMAELAEIALKHQGR
jgi:hypothetical protein